MNPGLGTVQAQRLPAQRMLRITDVGLPTNRLTLSIVHLDLSTAALDATAALQPLISR
jgi:hypothetical protein